MSENNVSYLRQEFLAPRPAPLSDRSAIGWTRRNLFASPLDAVTTVIFGAIILWFAVSTFDWLFISAVWTGDGRAVCATTVQGGIQPDGW
ncbi:MAG TPA: amino acid ABC transporter permease, partial [Rhizobium sp.]|nr:amino acid ABC transporter permease [Rhizobium sp.]